MSQPNPSNRRADPGPRLVRASVLIGIAASVGLQLGGGDLDSVERSRGAAADCAAPADLPITAL
jgi:hypothetical protein